MCPHVFIDCIGEYKTQENTKNLEKMRKGFSSSFVQIYLYSLTKIALCTNRKYICNLFIKDRYLIISTSPSLYPVPSEPAVKAVLIQPVNPIYYNVLERVDITDVAVFLSFNGASVIDIMEVENLLHSLMFINNNSCKDISISLDETLDNILSKLRELNKRKLDSQKI